MKLTKKERKEIGLIFGAVIIVALVGIGVDYLPVQNIFGMGITIDYNTDYATTDGALRIIKTYEVASGSGSCTDLCGDKMCIPWREGCDVNVEKNQCYCVNVPK